MMVEIYISPAFYL